MKNLIVLGAGSGDDIDHFKRNIVPGEGNWEIYAFEPGPIRCKNLATRFKSHPYIHCIHAAAVTFDGEVKLYQGKSGDNSRSTLANKINVRSDYHIVPAIDITEWMKRNIKETDYNVMVIDIEGGEYDVIDSIIEKEMLGWINELYIEFHGEKIEGFDMKRELDMVNALIHFYDKDVYIEKYYQHEKFIEMNSECVA